MTDDTSPEEPIPGTENLPDDVPDDDVGEDDPAIVHEPIVEE